MMPRSRNQSLLVLICLLVFGTAPLADAAVIHVFEFSQLSFDQLDLESRVDDSAIGRMSIAYDAGPVTDYLNVHAMIPGVSVEPFWIVRNLYLHSDLEGPLYEEVCVDFPLSEMGAASGTPLSLIEYGYTLTPDPILDADYPAWAVGAPLIHNSAIMPEVSAIGLNQPVNDEVPWSNVPEKVWYAPRGVPIDTTLAKILGCQVGNVELDSTQTKTDKNGCVPAGCANSLDWMKRTDPNIDFPGDLRSTYEKMSKLMGRTTPEGVYSDVMCRGKLDFIEAYNLPIEVKYQERYPKSSNYSSTSGESSATNHGAANTFPTKEWLKSEMDDGEDVEINVTYFYWYDGQWNMLGSHCVVVTGASSTAGANWIYVKHDDEQRYADPRKLKQQYSDINVNEWGAMELPGLTREVTLGDGTRVSLNPVVTSVISESYKAEVTGPPASETQGAYCDWFARTIPPNGSLELGFPPAGEGRCYNTTVWRLDRLTTPPSLVQEAQWNLNAGQDRVWKNEKDYPVTVYVHNDDKADGSFDVNVNVNPVVTGIAPDPGNPIMFAGFSLGGHDSLADEFSQVELGEFVTPPPIGDGFRLAEIPGHLAEFGGTRVLHLIYPIIGHNEYWNDMGLVIDVLTVASPGDILVDCPTTGTMDLIHVTAPGRYELQLGMANPDPQFDIILTAQNGLDIIQDSLGIPSLVPVDEGSGVGQPPSPLQLEAWPNPFNPSVTLTYRLPQAGAVDLSVFDLRGRHIATLVHANLDDGEQRSQWHGRNDAGRMMPAGSYVVRLTAGGLIREIRVTLVK
jgi:FlgD Ig-like domain